MPATERVPVSNPCGIGRFHLRLFIESNCNLRCRYCNPDQKRVTGPCLTDEQLCSILSSAGRYGITRVHYSGGEPTLRASLPALIRTAAECGFREQAITTNGTMLWRHLDAYVSAGLSRVTLSLDTISRERFLLVTGRDELVNVLRSLEACIQTFPETKVNCVVTKMNVESIPELVNVAVEYSPRLVLRFIELQHNQPVMFRGKAFFDELHVGMDEILSRLRERGPLVPMTHSGENPNCQYFRMRDAGITVGIIANFSRGYSCGDCHKIRVSPYGDVGICINDASTNVNGMTGLQVDSVIEEALRRRSCLNETSPHRKHLSTAYGFWRWGHVSGL